MIVYCALGRTRWPVYAKARFHQRPPFPPMSVLLATKWLHGDGPIKLGTGQYDPPVQPPRIADASAISFSDRNVARRLAGLRKVRRNSRHRSGPIRHSIHPRLGGRSVNARVRLRAENQRLREEVALLREEVRIKDARMARLDPHRRPQYPPTERMAILELKAARHWSLERTARAMLVTAATIASWLKRIDEDGPDALVQLPRPVNKFPELVQLRRPSPENALPHDGQGQDRPDPCPRGPAPGRDHRRPDAQGRSQPHRPSNGPGRPAATVALSRPSDPITSGTWT